MDVDEDAAIVVEVELKEFFQKLISYIITFYVIISYDAKLEHAGSVLASRAVRATDMTLRSRFNTFIILGFLL